MLYYSFALFVTIVLKHVSGHGYATSPRTRNWFAVEEGVDGQGVEGLPSKEYCPDCLNTNELPGGICGKPNMGSSYTIYNDSTGKPMPWISQETYVEGQEIIVKHFYTTHHYGHITLAACNLGKSSTQDCFDNPDNWLEFVRDNSYGMPKDVNHPERGYLKRGPMDFESVFKLPDNVYGDEVLIQWRYITANSCLPEEYTEYFNWAISNPDYDVVPTDWKGGNMQACDKYPQDGSKPDGGAPEQFWNCMEVSILSGTPTVPTPTPPAPTQGPENTPAPIEVVPNPSGIPFPCCSWYSDFCEQPNNSWCHSSESNCNTCTGVWRDNQPQPTPTVPSPTMPNPTTPFPPTNIPTTGVPCCSINLKDCMGWCDACHTSQESCESESNTFWMPWGEPVDEDSCIAITYSCVGHGKPCCPGMICNPDASSAPCIVDPSPPVSSPTLAPVSLAPVSSAPVTSPTSSPVAAPQPLPTEAPQTAPTNPPVLPEGCYSMNHKDCIPDGYPTEEDTCNLVWLLDGERTECIALGGKCNSSNSCCGNDIVCFGDGDNAACLPPMDNNEDDDDSVECTICDDLPNQSMISNGKACADVPNTLSKKCNKSNNWIKKGYCKISCQNAGFGYPDLVCCS